MTEMFYIKQHDLLPALQVQLLDDTVPVELADAVTVTFLMSNRRNGLLVAAPMYIHSQHNPGMNDPALTGVVSYRWQVGQTDIAGVFDAEIQINWAPTGVDGQPGPTGPVRRQPQTFPAARYLKVTVGKDLGGATAISVA